MNRKYSEEACSLPSKYLPGAMLVRICIRNCKYNE